MEIHKVIVVTDTSDNEVVGVYPSLERALDSIQTWIDDGGGADCGPLEAHPYGWTLNYPGITSYTLQQCEFRN